MALERDQPPAQRTLVLCFDGTNGSYGKNNTNVVKFVSLLQKDVREQQLVYYQPGVGTYESPGIMGSCRKAIAKLADQAVAWYLDAHVMGGYNFLMENYKEGDRICFIGFSRGAYTARALAGMLHKVGLLPKDNYEQVEMAYKMYKNTGKANTKLAHGFREVFSRKVEIEFIGCWDTVTSVGLFWGRHLPFSASTSIIKHFRHALSLDEHRVRFQPNTWHRNAPDEAGAFGDPERSSWVSQKGGGDTLTDVLEVWFAGCHSDIGGGATPSNQALSLSDITLRWMIRQVVDTQCGIQFDSDALTRAGISFGLPNPQVMIMEKFVLRSGVTSKGIVESVGLKTSEGSPSSPSYSSEDAKRDAECAIQPMDDELKKQPLWWIPEIIPFHQSWQDEQGRWHNSWRWNLGRPRMIALPSPNLHVTVQQRMGDQSLGYTPRAVWSNKPTANWVV